ncbi:ATP-dependent DNA ligase (plasmid) [Rhizobium leguminosarum]|uniref:non-homologous end-joining DNA ligase n=1 Tax=Rhizobium leguminosarum TaxID=384 RepID=UPI00103136F4|nr:non-homologous end-joining DNA ligase [Rhizobium leguminosarum]MBY5374603.1 ATP-dependent DNA ligase [Rhizobium leguminosarum]TBF25665.1 ATP-dependent DNA ligase [Rhizobium leguminosarum]TBF44618.1 ATP-dependent DNA ligase [Rhizobium leguminosarum]TBF47860.1 ATP-dependent DNA ligase [Rhizobium leguminosarum]TBF48500.1 ATP-dependent DNA ligase [Rhizobium leguminosarum]
MTKSPKPKPLLKDADKPVRSRPRKPRDPDQPNLPLDPMPDRIEPCLAMLKAKPPKGDDWVYEIKWDGYRLSVHIEPSGIRILTRGGHNWTDRFPAIKQAALWLPVGTAILDGEAVVLDEQGRSDFGLLQSLGGRGGKKSSSDAIFMAFDLLYFDGHDLRNSELSMRRHLLEDLVPASGQGDIRLSEEIEADGDQLLASACEHGLEGIIAKRRDAPYRSGRLGDWLKIKCVQSDSFFVVGYERSTAAGRQIASLLLAARKDDGLVYVGSVGTGFKESNVSELRDMMDKIIRKTPPLRYTGARKDVVWLQPTLIAEIEFRAWTDDGKLRHASYKGLRDVQDDASVFQLPQ